MGIGAGLLGGSDWLGPKSTVGSYRRETKLNYRTRAETFMSSSHRSASDMVSHAATSFPVRKHPLQRKLSSIPQRFTHGEGHGNGGCSGRSVTRSVIPDRLPARVGYHSLMRTRATLLALVAASLMSAQSIKSEPTVYVTTKGKKYHVRNCKLKSGSKGIKLSEAKKQKYMPCQVCKPPK